MADVAARAGVSTATVSRVLNDPDKVSPELRSRIQALVQNLGYVRHGPARAMAARRYHTIGAIVPTLGVATFASVVDVVQRRLEAEGLSLLIACSRYEPEVEARQVRMLLERGIDGIVLVGHRRPAETYKLLEDAGVPYVCAYTVERGKHPCVGFDHHGAMQRMIAFLHQLGHRRFGVITSPTHHNDRVTLRFEGALAGIAAAGLPAPEVVEAPYAVSDGRAAFRALIERAPGITAVVCTVDAHAIGALAEARALGLPVPGRLSIAGFDDLDIAAEVDPPLTTLHVPTREMGERVADILLARIANRPTAQTVELTVTLAVRASTGPAPA